MTPEGKVKAFVKRVLKAVQNKSGKQMWTHWPVQAGYGAPTLDCTGCWQGLAFAIETKAPGEKLTPRQHLTKADMESSGMVVFVIGEKETGDAYRYSGVRELLIWLVQHL